MFVMLNFDLYALSKAAWNVRKTKKYKLKNSSPQWDSNQPPFNS